MVRAAEVSAEGVRIFLHDPRGKVAKAYEGLTREVIRNDKKQKYKLNSYIDFFGVSDRDEQPVKISLNELHDFKNHPYRVVDDEDMQELANSVCENGVLVAGCVSAVFL